MRRRVRAIRPRERTFRGEVMHQRQQSDDAEATVVLRWVEHG
jgi:hypothetical protein